VESKNIRQIKCSKRFVKKKSSANQNALRTKRKRTSNTTCHQRANQSSRIAIIIAVELVTF
jgi:hypothetical protein